MRQPSLARGGRVAFRTQVRNRYHVIRAYPETGKVSALVGDDLENAVRELLSGRFQWAVERLRGVSEGLRRRR